MCCSIAKPRLPKTLNSLGFPQEVDSRGNCTWRAALLSLKEQRRQNRKILKRHKAVGRRWMAVIQSSEEEEEKNLRPCIKGSHEERRWWWWWWSQLCEGEGFVWCRKEERICSVIEILIRFSLPLLCLTQGEIRMPEYGVISKFSFSRLENFFPPGGQNWGWFHDSFCNSVYFRWLMFVCSPEWWLLGKSVYRIQ